MASVMGSRPPTAVRRFDGRVLAAAAALSVLTSPITAIWLLVLAPVALVATAVATSTRRSVDGRARTLRTGTSAAVGLLVGPLAYIGLAVLVTVA